MHVHLIQCQFNYNVYLRMSIYVHPCTPVCTLDSLTETKEELKKCKEELKSNQKVLTSQVEDLKNENERYACIHICYIYGVCTNIHTYACTYIVQ